MSKISSLEFDRCRCLAIDVFREVYGLKEIPEVKDYRRERRGRDVYPCDKVNHRDLS